MVRLGDEYVFPSPRSADKHGIVAYGGDLDPERIIEEAVKGMLPKNKLGKSMIKKLKVFKGPNHDHESQQPTEWKIS